jgi:hypothetical protein
MTIGKDVQDLTLHFFPLRHSFYPLSEREYGYFLGFRFATVSRETVI